MQGLWRGGRGSRAKRGKNKKQKKNHQSKTARFKIRVRVETSAQWKADIKTSNRLRVRHFPEYRGGGYI